MENPGMAFSLHSQNGIASDVGSTHQAAPADFK